MTNAIQEAIAALDFAKAKLVELQTQATPPGPAAAPRFPAPQWMTPPAPAPPPGYPQRPPARGEVPLAPFGRLKGAPLSTLESKDLQWLCGALQTSLGDPAKAQYAAKNQKDLANVQVELKARGL